MSMRSPGYISSSIIASQKGMVRPVFSDDVGTVYNVDCRSLVSRLTFDYVVSDPPYNIKFKYNDYDDHLSYQEYVDLLSILKPYKSVLIHYPEAFIGPIRDALGVPQKTVAWCYNSPIHRQHRMIAWFNSVPDFNKVRQPYKNAERKKIIEHMDRTGSEGARLYDWWSDINYLKGNSKEKVPNFTNQIPVQLLERILFITTEEGDTILDPFFGTGSLYFACKNTNRKCIGIEQSREHLNFFQDRLSRGY